VNNIGTSGHQKNKKVVTNHTKKYFESQRFLTVGRVREANNFFNVGPTETHAGKKRSIFETRRN
jgi:hypothetical protein